MERGIDRPTHIFVFDKTNLTDTRDKINIYIENQSEERYVYRHAADGRVWFLRDSGRSIDVRRNRLTEGRADRQTDRWTDLEKTQGLTIHTFRTTYGQNEG